MVWDNLSVSFHPEQDASWGFAVTDQLVTGTFCVDSIYWITIWVSYVLVHQCGWTSVPKLTDASTVIPNVSDFEASFNLRYLEWSFRGNEGTTPQCWTAHFCLSVLDSSISFHHFPPKGCSQAKGCNSGSDQWVQLSTLDWALTINTSWGPNVNSQCNWHNVHLQSYATALIIPYMCHHHVNFWLISACSPSLLNCLCYPSSHCFIFSWLS